MFFCCKKKTITFDDLRESDKFDKDTTLEGIKTKCKVVSVYDGDTCTVQIIDGNMIKQYKVRMLEYDCPEMKPKKEGRTEESLLKEKAIAKKAKDYFISRGANNNQLVDIEFSKPDKYGRQLAYMYLNGKNINQEMIDKHLAYNYGGGTKKTFDDLLNEGYYTI